MCRLLASLLLLALLSCAMAPQAPTTGQARDWVWLEVVNHTDALLRIYQAPSMVRLGQVHGFSSVCLKLPSSQVAVAFYASPLAGREAIFSPVVYFGQDRGWRWEITSTRRDIAPDLWPGAPCGLPPAQRVA